MICVHARSGMRYSPLVNRLAVVWKATVRFRAETGMFIFTISSRPDLMSIQNHNP
jgi:hypothetical protein